MRIKNPGANRVGVVLSEREDLSYGFTYRSPVTFFTASTKAGA